jgi:hypothetical protein
MQTISSPPNLSPIAKTVLEYYAKIFPSSARPRTVAEELRLNRNTVRRVVQVLTKAALLEHLKRGQYSAAEKIVEPSQPHPKPGSQRPHGQAGNPVERISVVAWSPVPSKGPDSRTQESSRPRKVNTFLHLDARARANLDRLVAESGLSLSDVVNCILLERKTLANGGFPTAEVDGEIGLKLDQILRSVEKLNQSFEAFEVAILGDDGASCSSMTEKQLPEDEALQRMQAILLDPQNKAEVAKLRHYDELAGFLVDKDAQLQHSVERNQTADLTVLDILLEKLAAGQFVTVRVGGIIEWTKKFLDR